MLILGRAAKSGTEQIGTFDDAAGEHAEQVLLDNVRLAVFHAFEPVCDMEAVADLLCARLDELEFGRVGKPADDQRGGVIRPCTLAEAGRNERAKRGTGPEARGNSRLIPGGYRLHEPRPNRTRQAASLGALRAGHPHSPSGVSEHSRTRQPPILNRVRMPRFPEQDECFICASGGLTAMRIWLFRRRRDAKIVTFVEVRLGGVMSEPCGR